MKTVEWGLIVVIGALIAAITRSWFKDMVLPTSWFLYVLVLFTMFLGEAVIMAFRINTPKIIATNFHETTDGKYYPAGDYAIYKLGAIKSDPFYVDGKKGALVCPMDAINHLGDEVVLTVNPRRIPINSFPPLVKQRILQEKIPPPYYFGIVSDRQELSEPNLARLQQEIEEQNQLINMFREVARNKFEVVGDVMDFMDSMKEAQSPKKILGIFNRKKKKKEDEFS